MTDEVMEPLTDTMLKRKSSRRSNNDTRESIDSPSLQKLPSKAPDKKKGFLSKISKSKGDQQKKRAPKTDLISNSIRNPSNQLELFETQNEKKEDTSPRVPVETYEDSNDSDFLIDNPSSSPGAQPPAAKRSQPDPRPDTISHPLPLSASSPAAIQPPFQNDSNVETNPVFSGSSPWCQSASPTCSIDPLPEISHSWEPYRSSPISHTVFNSYESHTTTHTEVSVSLSSDKMFPDLCQEPGKMIPSDVPSSAPISEVPNEFTSHKKSDSTQPLKDPNFITEPEFISFSSFFSKLDPEDGLLFGDQARNFFLRSELPNEELSKIWMLSDIDGDLKLTFNEFCIAMKLVRNRKKGIPLPSEVPLSIFNSLSIMADSAGEMLPSETLQDQQGDPPSYSSHLLPQYSDLPEEQTQIPSNPNIAPGTEQYQPSEETPTIEDLPSSLQQDTLDSTDTEDLEETVTVDNYLIQNDFEDPIPKLTNSSPPTNYTDQIKTLFTPAPNPIPPPPTKTQMQQRSVLTPILSSYEIVQPSPRVEVTPVVQMRSYTTDSSTCPPRDKVSGFVEGAEDSIILSLPSRGGTDPRDMKNKKKMPRKRPDRVSAIILIDRSDNEESMVSLVNKGEVRTIELSPQKGDEDKLFMEDLTQLDTPDNEIANEPEKPENESTPHSSPSSNPVKPVSQKKDSRMNILKKKLMKRNKKTTGSNVSLEKAEATEAVERKKNKSKKTSKKEKKQHKRSNSLDINSVNPRCYGSQNDIHLGRKEDSRVPVVALTELYSSQKSVSTLSLSPSHNPSVFQPQNEYDSFDSTGSSDNDNLQSDDAVESAPRLRTRKKRIDRANRSLSSPECILSTPPIPDASSDRNDNTFATPEMDLDDNKTPLHETLSEPTPQYHIKYEREMLTQRIHEMIAKCDSLKCVNNQLTSELNQIRLQKNELAMQLRYHRPRNFL